MENKSNDQQNGWQSEGESLNTGSQQSQEIQESDNRQQTTPGQKHNTTLAAGNIGTSATAQVDPHSNAGLALTGTNISYEGPTAPGSGGSAGTGYTSGKSGVDPKISTNTDAAQGAVGKHYDKAEGNDDVTDGKAGTADVSE